MNITVCVKQVLDPEAPTSLYEVDSEGKRVVLKGVPPLISPFDENALEVAMQIKGSLNSKVRVISVGQNLSRPVLRKTLAVGADELILIEDASLGDIDSYATALLLATAIKKAGDYDLILTGREASDSNAGVVGPGIAELLGIPCITIARKVEVPADGKVKVQRIISDGYELVETSLPAVITVSNEVGELRSATVQAMIAAQKKTITTWNIDNLGIQLSPAKKNHLLKLFIPKKEVKCEFVQGETVEEKGKNLALKLKESGLL